MPLYRNQGRIIFFVHIPKTGGTTVEKALRMAGAAQAMKFPRKNSYSKATLQHMHAKVYRNAISPDFYDWAFAVVRDPFARFASEFKMKVVDGGEEVEIEQWAAATFGRYAEYNYTRDNHIRPQAQFVSKGVKVFRFEDGLETPIARACKRLGLQAPETPHARKGSAGRVSATPATIEMIRDFYKVDFERFGYDPDAFRQTFEVDR